MTSIPTIPIIIYHLGKQEYLKKTLSYALKINSNVININEYDNIFPDIAQLKCVSYKPYSKYMEQFKSLYKHFSTNSYQL
jgi:hypothetical protein